MNTDEALTTAQAAVNLGEPVPPEAVRVLLAELHASRSRVYWLRKTIERADRNVFGSRRDASIRTKDILAILDGPS